MVDDLAVRAGSYGMPGVVVDGQDVGAMHAGLLANTLRACELRRAA